MNDISSFIIPINEEYPQGVDCRHGEWSATFYQLKDLRNTLRNEERQALSIDDIYAGYSDWRKLHDGSVELIEKASKDLEVIAWIIEASIRLQGFQGLANSLRLLQAILSDFWPNLYPKDEDGFESTLFPLTGLNGVSSDGALIMPLRMAPLFPASECISLLDCIKAFEVSETKDPKKKEALKQKGLPDYEQLQAQVANLGVDNHRQAISDIQSCLDTYSEIDQFLVDQCGHDSPPSSLIKSLLTEALERATHLSGYVDSTLSNDHGDQHSSETEPLEHTSAERTYSEFNINAYQPASRHDAFILIRKLIVFFKETEPHSPIAYNLERINRWGDLSLPELIGELITDESARANFNKITGVEVINK